MKKRICTISVIILTLLAVVLLVFKFTTDDTGSALADTPIVESNAQNVENNAQNVENIDTNLSQNEKETFEEPLEPIKPKPIEPPSIQIVMVGDMLMHGRVMESGLKEDGSYNFDHLFANVKDSIEGADLALVNQETILGGTELGLSGYPAFNSPYELGDSLVAAGFDVILHATNHTLDKGKKGVLNCMNFWDTNYPEIAYLGINKSQEEQDTNIYIYEQDGIEIAILNYTYGTNGIPTPDDMPYIVNYLDEEKIISDLTYAEENADFTVVCPHWGTEYVLSATDSQKKWAKIFMENGADLVIGTHPHVIEPVEMLTDENGNEMLVYYSIGNFVNGTSGTGDGTTNRMVGGIADVTVSLDETGKAYIESYDVIPIVCHIDEKTEYTVYYLSDYTEELAKENHIVSQDSNFSLEACKNLVNKVWNK